MRFSSGAATALHRQAAARYYRPMGRYRLVDFAAHYQKGFRNHVVPIADVLRLTASFGHFGCYATYFFFSDELLTYMSAQAGEAPSVAGYQGKVWAPYLPIDLDHPELTPALEAARALSRLLLDGWRLEPAALQIYFSGAKGFHLMVDGRSFGHLAPSQHLPALFDTVRRHLALELPEGLRATVDLAIKDRLRLLRLPNTIHEKSKLYKIRLDADELARYGAAALRELARQPRPLVATDATGLVARSVVGTNPRAEALYQRVRRQLRSIRHRPFEYRLRRAPLAEGAEFSCAGMQAIWQSHIEPGFRNNCAIRLASELRLHGFAAEETLARLKEWNQRQGIDLDEDEIAGVVRSAYQHRFPYRYSCHDPVLRRYCPLVESGRCLTATVKRQKGAV